ncbi:MAG TPA: hypothetical protein VM487_02360, partial [Phycisphaerae bacterium]|nr:hypothetical protein [Phycisphaerae bacterium]
MTDDERQIKKIAGYEAQRQFNELGNLVKRGLKMNRLRPGPPRNLRFEENLLKWDPPADTSAVTHYRVRIGHDTGPPDFELSAGQTALQLFKGESFLVSSYNVVMDQESTFVGIGAGYGVNGNVGLGAARGGITFSSISAALSDPNDFGLRFWLITCNYSTSVAGLKGVAVWVENPVDGTPDRLAQSTYIPTQANSAVVAILPPDTSRTIRVYLVGIWDLEDPLLTVAEHGEQASSAHKTVDIGPVPTETQGVEWTANVTSPGVTKSTYKDSNGLTRTRLTVTFTPPADARWGGVEIDAKRPGPIYEQLNRTSVSPAVFPIESPSTSQTWRIFFRSYDKRGKTNSLNETGAGTPTPYVDIVLGADTGTFDAAKIQQNTLSDALYIAANVLGIKPLGITEDLIGTFAVSQAKLANAPIIDAVRIVDGAIGTAKIENAAITSALIGTGVILTAHIGDAQITSAKIANLQVDKITGWSGALINFGTGCYFQGHASFQNTVSVYGSFQSHLNAIFFGTTEFGNTVTVNSGV